MKYTKTTADQISWLASTHLQSFTESADAAYVSGAVFKKDNVAIGLVLNDVKGSTDDPMPAAVMVEGWVLEDRLPAALSADDKTALKAVGIKFRGDVPAAATAPSEG
ncbi:hypothetical protein [Weissella paramesenteroides]|uniref:hypothetical protein n=1 Tax=Weissella paramesenteroides TaxID=1249 RepID=UPI0018DA904D|nr:hypothetical protein [Weissella paramesenteroides]QPI46245.1 hypothetical protein I2E55_09730 [Weissella paramesenteroides]